MQAFIDNKMGGEGTYGLIGSKQASELILMLPSAA
jgi:hypothetical protein